MSKPSASSTTRNRPIWDRQAAQEAVGGDAELARMLVEQLAAELPDDLTELRQLMADGNLPALADKAHAIRGGAIYCGVTALVDALTSLDLSAKTGAAERAAVALDGVADEIARLSNHLQET